MGEGIEYTLGDLVLLAGPDLVVVFVPGASASPLIRNLWSRVCENLDSSVPLTELIGPSGPIDLALVDHAAVVRARDEEVSAVLKGSLALLSSEPPDEADQAALPTGWRAQICRGAGEVVLATTTSHRSVEPDWLPLREGVARAASVRWRIRVATAGSLPGRLDHLTPERTTTSAAGPPAPPAGAARIVEHSVSYRMLFGSHPPVGTPEPELSEPPAASVVQPKVPAHQATLLPSDLTPPTPIPPSPSPELAPPQLPRHGPLPARASGGEAPISALDGAQALRALPDPDPSAAPSLRPPGERPAALPRMPEGWVHRRGARRAPEPPVEMDRRTDGETSASQSTPAQPVSGRAPAFLTRVATPGPTLAPTSTPANPPPSVGPPPIGYERPILSLRPVPLVDALPPGGIPSASMPPAPPPLPADLRPMRSPTEQPGVVQATVHASALVSPPDDGQLLAVRCSFRHLNPPEATSCRVCGRPVTERLPAYVARPQLGRLCRPGHPDLPVTGPMLLGRRPEWRGPGPAPEPVTVQDPAQTISRSHASISVSGWDVSVTDLGSANGTRLELPDGQIRALVPHRPVVIPPSTVIVLADVVKIWFQVP